jgi:hypothetical protein
MERKKHNNETTSVEKMNKKKGIIFSMDAMIAMLLTLILFLSVGFYLTKIENNAVNTIYLKQVAADTLTVMEKSNALENAIRRDQTILARSFLNNLPFRVCGEIRLISNNDLNNAKISLTKKECSSNYTELVVMQRSFLTETNNNIEYYIAELKVWRRN